MISQVLRSLLPVLLLFSSSLLAAPQIPALSGRVVDNAGMLSAETKAQLSAALAEHESSTSNQLVVLTVPDLQGYDVAEFAIATARNWQLGQRDKDNGVLLLVAKAERKIRIEVGYGLEGDLPDVRAKRIIQSVIRPAFKQGNFSQGISAGVDAIIGTIDGSYTPSESSDAGKNSLLLPLGMLGLFGFSAFLQGRVPRKYINGMIGGGFSGTMISLATQKWYIGVVAGLALGFLLSRARSQRGDRNDGSRHGVSQYGGGFGSNSGGGGFGGGGGGFGGGGASGGW